MPRTRRKTATESPIKKRMKKLGIDAVALGKKAGVHANTVRNFINGRQVRAADKITAALDALAAAANNNNWGAAHAAGNKPNRRAAARAEAHTQRAPRGERVGDPSAAAPPMVFEHKNDEYARIAKRIQDGVTELNASLKEAHKRADMRVFMGWHGGGDGHEKPGQLGYHIYRLTHSVITLAIRPAEPVWQQVKDPTFKDISGDGLAALARERAEAGEAAAAT